MKTLGCDLCEDSMDSSAEAHKHFEKLHGAAETFSLPSSDPCRIQLQDKGTGARLPRNPSLHHGAPFPSASNKFGSPRCVLSTGTGCYKCTLCTKEFITYEACFNHYGKNHLLGTKICDAAILKDGKHEEERELGFKRSLANINSTFTKEPGKEDEGNLSEIDIGLVKVQHLIPDTLDFDDGSPLQNDLEGYDDNYSSPPQPDISQSDIKPKPSLLKEQCKLATVSVRINDAVEPNSDIMECDICHAKVEDLSTHIYTVHFEPGESAFDSEANSFISHSKSKRRKQQSREINSVELKPPYMNSRPLQNVGAYQTMDEPERRNEVATQSSVSTTSTKTTSVKYKEITQPSQNIPFKVENSIKNSLAIIVPSQSEREMGKWKCKFNPATSQFTCMTCKNEFGTRALFDSHYEKVHLGIRYQCKICQVEFDGMNSYFSHYGSVHLSSSSRNFERQKMFQCELCKNGKQKCKLCGKEFNGRASLTYHYSVVHKRVGYKCGRCNKILTTKGNLKRHQSVGNNCRLQRESELSSPNHPLANIDSTSSKDVVKDDQKKLQESDIGLVNFYYANQSALDKHIREVHMTQSLTDLEKMKNNK